MKILMCKGLPNTCVFTSCERDNSTKTFIIECSASLKVTKQSKNDQHHKPTMQCGFQSVTKTAPLPSFRNFLKISKFIVKCLISKHLCVAYVVKDTLLFAFAAATQIFSSSPKQKKQPQDAKIATSRKVCRLAKYFLNVIMACLKNLHDEALSPAASLC